MSTVDSMKAEVVDFEALANLKSALLFPSTNSYERFQVHQFVEAEHEHLKTFSVGEGRSRRLVVAWRDTFDARQAEKAKENTDNSKAAGEVNSNEKEAASGENEASNVDVEAKSQRADDGNTDGKTESGPKEDGASTAPSDNASRGKRPDRAIYVPRGGRRGRGGGRGRGRGRGRGDGGGSGFKSEGFGWGGQAKNAAGAAQFSDPVSELKESLGNDVDVVESRVIVPEPEKGALYYDSVPPKPDCILEVYDFSSELKTMDLKNDLNTGFRNRYEMRWVDDTHALAIFHATVAAEEALIYNGFKLVKVRKLEEATAASKEKAELCFSKSGPPTVQGPRPETSTLVARRMLGGALGVSMLPTDLEAKEKSKLANAKRAKEALAADASAPSSPAPATAANVA